MLLSPWLTPGRPLRRSRVAVCAILAALALLSGARDPAAAQSIVLSGPPGQEPDYPAPPPPPTPYSLSLSRALSQVPPAPGVAIAVDAEHTGLPEGHALPRPGASAVETGQAFGRLTHRFGAVTAIAPSTMVVLNTRPTGENLYLGMPPAQVFDLLLAGLDEAGWDALTGERGLGSDDLRTAEEGAMFAALFPSGSLNVAPPQQGNAGPDLTHRRDLPANAVAAARVRLARSTTIALPAQTAAGRFYFGTNSPTKPGAPKEYLAVPTAAPAEQSGVFAGVHVRAERPNQLKPGQLNITDRRFDAAISLAGLQTVGDLVARISAVTRTGIYADQRLERLSLAVRGSGQSAPAHDLLHAVALCVFGT